MLKVLFALLILTGLDLMKKSQERMILQFCWKWFTRYLLRSQLSLLSKLPSILEVLFAPCVHLNKPEIFLFSTAVSGTVINQHNMTKQVSLCGCTAVTFLEALFSLSLLWAITDDSKANYLFEKLTISKTTHLLLAIVFQKFT